MASDFVLDWEKALGYKADPFVDKILEPASLYLVNRVDEKEKLNWFFIKGYFFGSMIGEHGVGKTMLFKWLQERLHKYDKVHCVYINAAVFKEQINIPQQILMPLLSLVERVWTKPHQNNLNFDYVGFLRKKLGRRSVALLIDNAHSLTDRNVELIKALREEGLKIQVIVATTQTDYEKSRLSEFGSDELNLTLRRLTFEESKDMLHKRIEGVGGRGIAPFSSEELARLYDRADKNPRQFLHICRDEAIKILIHRAERDRKPVSEQPKKKADPESKKQALEPLKLDSAIAKKKKSFLNVKFDMGKKDKDVQNYNIPGRDSLAPPSFSDRKNLFTNDRYNQALVDKLASSKPKKRLEHDSDVSDIDRIIKDISNTMKGKDE